MKVVRSSVNFRQNIKGSEGVIALDIVTSLKWYLYHAWELEPASLSDYTFEPYLVVGGHLTFILPTSIEDTNYLGVFNDMHLSDIAPVNILMNLYRESEHRFMILRDVCADYSNLEDITQSMVCGGMAIRLKGKAHKGVIHNKLKHCELLRSNTALCRVCDFKQQQGV